MARTLPEEKHVQPQWVLLQGNGTPGRQGLQSGAECPWAAQEPCQPHSVPGGWLPAVPCQAGKVEDGRNKAPCSGPGT